MMKYRTFFFLLLISWNLQAQHVQDTLLLYFEIDEYKLDEDNQERVKNIISYPFEEINILGYTDTTASISYNQSLSNKRAYSTYFYLLNNGIDIPKIKQVKGMGELFKQSEKNNLDACRKVEIIYTYTILIPNEIEKIMKEELTSSAKELTEKIQTSKKGDNLVIKNIHFYPGSHQHLPQSEPEMKALLNILKNEASLKIEIQGHICCQDGGIDGYDNDTGERILSVNRAYHIYQYLIDHGISPQRLSYKGFGSSQKIFPYEHNEKERIANRRVEILILER